MPATTPYISAEMLLNSAFSLPWQMLPNPQSSTTEQYECAVGLAWQATSRIDSWCQQVLRSTADTESLNGPGAPRCNVNRNTGTGELQVRRWPVTEVLAIQVSPSRSFPRVWTAVPAGQWDIRHPLIYSGDSAAPTAPDGGWTIDVAPGWIGCSPWARTPTGGYTGSGGRGSQRVQVSYLNGWPHTSLTQDAAQGDDMLYVDDVTGWAGAAGMAYDGSATEQASVSAVTATSPLVLPNGAGTADAGPGTLTLSSPLANDHQAGTVISALPAVVLEAAVYAAAIQALEGGADAITVQTISGEKVSSGDGITEIETMMHGLLQNFRRAM